jgi:lipoprotein signal peptidase
MLAVPAILLPAIVSWLPSPHATTVAAVIGLAFGGATGNLLDQRRIGGVRDFVDFGLGAFNLADVAIVAGTTCAALLVIAGGCSGCEPRPH